MFAASCPDADPSAITANPHGPWQLVLTSIKPWPCCRHTHPAIDAALELATQIRHPVRQVIVRTYQAALDVCDRPRPDNDYEAKFSLQHSVAAALDTGAIGFDSFNHHARTQAVTTAASVRLELSPHIDAAYPADWGCEVEVITDQGTTLKASRSHCKGDPDLPLNDTAMREKAQTLLAFGGLTETEGRALIDYVLDIQNRERIPDVTGFLERRI